MHFSFMVIATVSGSTAVVNNKAFFLISLTASGKKMILAVWPE